MSENQLAHINTPISWCWGPNPGSSVKQTLKNRAITLAQCQIFLVINLILKKKRFMFTAKGIPHKELQNLKGAQIEPTTSTHSFQALLKEACGLQKTLFMLLMGGLCV